VSPFRVRGVIEGFYGPPWSHAARCRAVATLAAHGMNAYVYAPKSDPKHRDRWRDTYDSHESARFRDLATHCATHGTTFGFAISPGLDIAYAEEADRAALLEKLSPLADAGIAWFVLALDDIPLRTGLAAEQADLTAWLHGALATRGATRLTVVPTEYVGTRPSQYLADLDAGLPADVDLMWTGPTVCSPEVSAADAVAWRRAVGDRATILWDNYPVNDAVMERELHLGAYRGRDAALAAVLDGVLCNPMLQPTASLVPLLTAARFLADPAGYDERAAWDGAVDEVGGSGATALRAIGRACSDGPLAPASCLPAHALVTALGDEIDGPGWMPATVALRDELDALLVACLGWDDDDELGQELRPWLQQARREADAAAAALRLLQHLRPVACRDADGRGRAATIDAEASMLHCFALLFAWRAARDATRAIVLGPRFGMHPAVIQLADGRPAVDVGLALREDQSVVDRLCRLALDHYERWVADPASDIRIMADGADVPVAANGSFAAPAPAVVLLRSGGLATRLPAPSAPPYPDGRLA
jgi:hyaluronoglucosaminidase